MKTWSWFSCYQFCLHSALGKPFTKFPVQILGKIIKKFTDLSVFPIYVIVIFNLNHQFSWLTSEVGAFSAILFVEFPTYDCKGYIFFWQIKPNKLIKSKKYWDLGCRPGKLASDLKINFTKIGKMLILQKI